MPKLLFLSNSFLCTSNVYILTSAVHIIGSLKIPTAKSAAAKGVISIKL